MRIPLDYYRILGLPIQATAEQLQQAHRDRTQQLPRREYSEAAIASRKSLVDDAYEVLSNPEERQAYDAAFLAKAYDLAIDDEDEMDDLIEAPEPSDGAEGSTVDQYAPTIEIEPDQLVGALLILQELGEYELVIKLGRPYLSSGSVAPPAGRFGAPDAALADIVLTVALACLELGREQWQQGQYENAAESLDTGQDLLQREGYFDSLRQEIIADLYKLRPYRILELLALPETYLNARRQGLRLLQQMLQERGGIDGNGDDHSGLNIDDFLRFIQQLRGYLTAAEQQTLFEAEAHRPSAVAVYLAVYALLARGFAQQQPALVRRAKQMLMRLGNRQDVHLEQAVCALLLGQTEEASRALELSQEYEPLAFIREHSQGAPDLLPGLCLYAERWLQQEVFPHFRDLADQAVALKDYFANEQVQTYLEALPQEADTVSNMPQPTVPRVSSPSQPAAMPPVSAELTEDIRDWRTRDLSPREITARSHSIRGIGSGTGTATAFSAAPQSPPSQYASPSYDSPAGEYAGEYAGHYEEDESGDYERPANGNGYASRSHGLSARGHNGNGVASGSSSRWAAEISSRFGTDRAVGRLTGGLTGRGAVDPGMPTGSSRLNGGGDTAESGHYAAPKSLASDPDATVEHVSQLSPEGSLSPSRPSRRRDRQTGGTATLTPPALDSVQPASRTSRDRAPASTKGLRIGRLGLVIFIFLLVLGGLGVLASRALNWLRDAGTPELVSSEQLQLQLAAPPVDIPDPDSPEFQANQLTTDKARQLIEQWLQAKQAAYGPDHNAEPLANILLEPELSRRQQQVAELAGQNLYWGYEHEVFDVSVTKPEGEEAERAVIEAQVREKGDFYSGGLIDPNESYDSTLQVRYTVVQQDDQWKVQEMGVAP